MKILIFLFLPAIFILQGCSQSCDRTVTSVAHFQNTTGKELTLNVCFQGLHNPKKVTVPAGETSDVVIESHPQKMFIDGNKDNVCAPITSRAPVSLTSDSFTQAKFCQASIKQQSKVQIVEAGKACPKGFHEQTTAVDDCFGRSGGVVKSAPETARR